MNGEKIDLNFACGSLQSGVVWHREIKRFTLGEVAEWSKARAC
jgi:hypothetical protein